MSAAAHSIVICADGGAPIEGALDIAVGLAASLNLTLEVIFVEETALTGLGDFAFVSAVNALSTRRFNRADMRAALALEAGRLRRRVSALAARSGVSVSFTVQEGSRAESLGRRQAAGELYVLPARPERAALEAARALAAETIARGAAALLTVEAAGRRGRGLGELRRLGAASTHVGEAEPAPDAQRWLEVWLASEAPPSLDDLVAALGLRTARAAG